MRKKEKTIATAAAVALAAALVFGGGTLAYFTWTSDEIDNVATNNYNWVSLTEYDASEEDRIGGSKTGETETNDTYEIIPGTSQDKDPLVTASYSLDSYVFVEVTDTSGGLITWDPADGWTLLTSTEDGNGNITWAVYYQLLTTDVDPTGDAETYGIDYWTAKLDVLDGNSISYDSSITNDDNGITVNEKGEVTEVTAASYSLTFQAYIIQADITGDSSYGTENTNETPMECWYALAGETGLGVAAINGELYDTLAEAITDMESGETITLLTDLTLNSSAYTYTNTVEDSEYTIDLNGYTMTTGASFTLKSSGYVASNITIKNGTIDNASTSPIRLEAGTTAIFEDVTLANSSSTSSRVQGAVQYYLASGDTENSISFDECTFDNTYVEITSGSGTYKVDIDITNCTFDNIFYASGYGGSAISLGNYITPDMTVKNCSFTAVANHNGCSFIKIPTTSGHGEGTITVKNCAFDLTASGNSNTCIYTGNYFKGTENVEDCIFKVTAKSGNSISAINANTSSSAGGKMTLNLTNVTVNGINDGATFKYPVYIMHSNYVTVNENGSNTYTIDGAAVTYSGGIID